MWYACPPFAQLAKIEANTRAKRSKKTIKNWWSTKPKIAIFNENLAKIREELKSVPQNTSETDFWRFWLDFGVPWRPQKHQKSGKKQAEKTAKFQKPKKQEKI